MTTQIQPLPIPPQPSDTPAEFNSKAFTFLGALPEFAEQTNALAVGAQQNADVAAASKTSALASQNAAKTSETNSASSNAAAASSQAAAKTSETNAGTSATAAANSAAAALASQNAAKTSETNSVSSKTAAASSQTAAKTSETNSKASETAAASSAAAALASQNAAKTSETNAASSETAATASQNAAKASEASAKTSETNASASAAAAAKSAEDAANSAIGQAVKKTSDTGAALLPEGDSAQRPAVGNIPAGALVVRGNTQDPADYWAEFWDRATSKWRAFADRTWVGQQIDTAVLAVKAWVNQQIGFAIIYPNGGSAASPANIAVNSRYVLANPFPGQLVICEVQLQIGGVWGGVGGFIYSTASGSQAFGVLARQYGDSIVVQTGVTALLSANNFDGNPFPGSGNVSAPTPARVLISKVKGAV